jgi:hypothetical protein
VLKDEGVNDTAQSHPPVVKEGMGERDPSAKKGWGKGTLRFAALEQMLAFAREQLEKTERDRDAWRVSRCSPRRSWWLFFLAAPSPPLAD